LLGDHGHDARRQTQAEQGQLLPEQAADLSGLLKTLQRPVIQQEQDERQGHQHGLRHQAQRKEQHDEQISPRPRSFDVPAVRPHREQPEEGGQDVLALGHPRHGFHVERVEGKQGGDDDALPAGLRHPKQNDEQQHGIRDVEQKIREMVPAGSQPEELNVRQVGDPRQRVPIGEVKRREGPADPFERDSLLNLSVFRDITRVIEIDEIALSDLPKHCQRHSGKQAEPK